MDLEESFANLSVTSEIASPRRKNPVIQKFHNLGPPHLRDPSVAVILAPQCYQHQFARLWESKQLLKSIVERPERLNACALGIGAAGSKVPLQLVECTGGRDLRESDAAIAVHGTPWIENLYLLCREAGVQHAKRKVEVPDSWPAGDMYLCPDSLGALESVVGAIEQALDIMYSGEGPKRVFCSVRPPGHHCHQEAASGFCLLNNAHIAIEQAREFGVTHAVIFDFDLHHGDGTQDLCWKLGKDRIAYFSLHDIHSFPTERDYADPENIMAASTCVEAHDMHIWNVHLESWADEAAFDKLYERKYSVLFKQAVKFLEKHREDASFKPLVVISAGFDASEYELKSMQRHKVSVPTSFFNRFTRDCNVLADSFGDGHVLSLLEGGYSNQALSTGVFSHLTGLSGLEWEPEWVDQGLAEEFDKGANKSWKSGKKWPSEAIQMGRQLFSLRPPSTPKSLGSPNTRARSKRLNLEQHQRAL